MKAFLTRFTAVAAFSLVAVSAAQADINTYRAHGTVQQVDASNHKITLSQDAVTELGWPVRTITYNVDGDNVLTGIKAGQKVDATFTAESVYQPSVHFVTPTAY